MKTDSLTRGEMHLLGSSAPIAEQLDADYRRLRASSRLPCVPYAAQHPGTDGERRARCLSVGGIKIALKRINRATARRTAFQAK